MNLSGEEHKYSVHSRDHPYQTLREEKHNTKETETIDKKETEMVPNILFCLVCSSTFELSCLVLYSEKLISLASGCFFFSFMSLKIRYFREK